ncbi:MAG: Gfo/Idh/MocA family protein, partial [bacterium]
MKMVAFAVVGIRNFAGAHINYLKELEMENNIQLAAVVVENPKKSLKQVRELKKEGITVFNSFSKLLKKGSNFVDIITLPVSIPSHSRMAVTAMEAGYDVLLEKPPAPTVQEMDRIIAAEERTG